MTFRAYGFDCEGNMYQEGGFSSEADARYWLKCYGLEEFDVRLE